MNPDLVARVIGYTWITLAVALTFAVVTTELVWRIVRRGRFALLLWRALRIVYQEARPLMPKRPRCYDCGELHWYNFWVADEVWEQIKPSAEGTGGVLCVRCIDLRCTRKGLTDVVGWFHFVGHALRPAPEQETSVI